MEKREVSLAKSLTLVNILLEISLIQSKSSGSGIEQWGTSAFTGFHSEV